MLAHLAHLLHLPPFVAYIIVLSALLIGAVAMGWILHRIFHRIAQHVKGAWGDLTIEVLEYLVLPLLVVGAVDVAVEVLELPLRWEHIVRKLVSAVILVVIFNLLARAVAVLLRNLAKKDPGFVRLTQPAILAERVIFGFLALTIFLENLGVSLTAVWTTLGVGSVAIGLALQATLSNLFAGITILADRPVSTGDHITLPGLNVEGEVVRIGWRATELRTPSNEVAFVPNSTMASSVLMNYSLSGSGATASTIVKVNPSSDSEQVESTLQEAAKKVAEQFKLPTSQPPQVTLTSDFTDPILQFTVNVPVPNLSDRAPVSAALRKEIAQRYRAGELKRP
jgi:small-conductance mechanosensitive channel